MTESAIRVALAKLAWEIQEERLGSITALRAVSGRQLLAQINYDQATVTVGFVGSQNLDQEQRGSAIYINRQANIWLWDLQAEIRNRLASGPPSQTPAPNSGSR